MRNGHPEASAEKAVGEVILVKRRAQVLGDHLCTGEDGKLLRLVYAHVVKARCLDRAAMDAALDLVVEEGMHRLTLHLLGDDQQRSLLLNGVVARGEEVRDADELSVGHVEECVLELALRHLGVGGKEGEVKPRSKDMPLTSSSSVLSERPSCVVMTPSLFTCSIASLMRLPISWSMLAKINATCAIYDLDFTGFACYVRETSTSREARSVPRMRSMEFVPVEELR